jgi:hypothetical protein
VSAPRRFDPQAFLARLWKMDAALVAAGFPATSPWWREQIERFVRRGCRRWVIRAGRRAGKSSTLCRLAVAWAWFGPWSVPPGDVAVIPFVSVSKDESGARLRTIATLLRTLGLPCEQRGDELEQRGARAVVFRAIACTTSSVVGFTSVAVFGDEVARWEARDTAANPAREVLGSLMPTMATQPRGFAALCSSPWSVDDFHAELFEQGDTEHQTTSFAPTWIANPTITEAETHALEPDEKTWSREYAAEPGVTVSKALDSDDLAACFGRAPSGELRDGFMSTDASSLRGDDYAYLGGKCSSDDEFVVSDVGGWSGAELRNESMASIVEHISDRAKALGTVTVFGDQREEASLRSLYAQRDISFVSFPWSEQSKDSAVMLLRRLMRERKLLLPHHDTLRRELRDLKARLMPSGRVRYETNGRDYASALITLCHAIDQKALVTSEADMRIGFARSARSSSSGSRLW